MKNRVLIEHIVSTIVLLILLLFTYVNLVIEPYRGFYFNETTGEIITVFAPTESSNSLQSGDVIKNVGPVSWEKYKANLRLPLFENLLPGQETKILITRDGAIIPITWTMPVRSSAEFFDRLANVWWLAYFFWFAGLASVLVIRPLDVRQILLVAFLYLTALWLMFGAIGGTHLWHSAVLFRSAIWLSVPVYLHLHWVFPEPIRQTSTKYWVPLYLIGIGLALAEWFQIPPVNASAVGILVAMGGSVFLLLVHYIFKRDQRRDVAILGILTLFAFIPSIIYLSLTIVSTPSLISVLGLFTLAGLPGAYFYVAYRRQPGWLELRTNRIIALYLYLILVFGLAFLTALLVARNELGDEQIPLTALALLCITTIAIIGFPYFQRLIEHRLLGMPLAPDQVLEAYATSITTSLNRAGLGRLLSKEILPSLQIRQSALVQKYGDRQPEIIFTYGAKLDLSAIDSDLELLHPNIRQPKMAKTMAPSWLRLTIPLTLDGEVIGKWLFGQKDPNDIYSDADIRLLKQLAHQTAIALANINKTELLQNLYAANIQRQEEERTHLARTLHDDVLNDLVVLGLHRLDESDKFATTHERIVNHIRLIIRGLRPAMLDYGLWRALDDSIDDLRDRAPAGIVLKLEIPRRETRYQPEIEQHLFRIVQQAVENSLEHSRANTITIHGDLQQTGVAITVEDNGIGLHNAQDLNFSDLLSDKHFGLVSMFERAELIGAQLNITSAINEFTRVDLVWHPVDDEKDANP